MEPKPNVYKCKHCIDWFIPRDSEDDDWLEEALWAHVQMEHESIFDEIQNLESPDMIEHVYDVYVE